MVGEVPIDCFFTSLFKSHRRFPAQIHFYLACVDGIAEFMSGPVLYKFDKSGRGSRGTAKFFVHDLAEQMDQVNIFPLIVASDVIGLAVLTFMKYMVYGFCMVANIKPYR